ncbi:hypothetical protein [Streptomyces roseoverticillatus]|uniref:hypothetical protein n=1 Tax=Streptomyces roseoverticillatus TaxID=66429 RepID=UPI0004C0940B|nr:hypothetical protein [Streptomyces roseoverticillatus]
MCAPSNANARLRVARGNRPRPAGIAVRQRQAAAISKGLPERQLDLPGRWTDKGIAWREQDDHLNTGARTAVDRLAKDAHTEPYGHADVDWPSWRTFATSL